MKVSGWCWELGANGRYMATALGHFSGFRDWRIGLGLMYCMVSAQFCAMNATFPALFSKRPTSGQFNGESTARE